MQESRGKYLGGILFGGRDWGRRDRLRPTLIVVLCLFAAAFGVMPVFAGNPDGDLRIEIMSAYNLVVDSNVESPSTYAPRSAYLGAKIYNDGSNDLTDVYAYIGDFTNSTPGIYPARNHMTLAAPPGGFSLTHEGGSAGTTDATRYLGTIPAGGYVAVYWLVSYPNLDENGKAVWGPSVKPDDDLWLEYYIWATADDAGTPVEADIKRKITMRNEISAAANKIYPNGANKVPDAYKELLEKYDPAWTNLYSDGTPGTRIWTEGVWYDLGNVGDGFDNDGDLVPDKNAWMQPVGDPSVFDPASFRLVRTYAMVVVKLKGGGEQVYNVEDQLYFQNLPENNGAVGLVRYEFLPLKSGGYSALTPYQEVASGFDNEKFNGDYGASIGSGISSGTSKVEIDKTGNVTVTPGGTIDYQISFTNSGFVKVGDPSLNAPLVIVDVIPTGTTYVAGSATSNNVLPSGVGSYTVLFSTNNGVSWTDVEPASVADITDVQWWLSDGFDTNAFGSIGFTVDVDNPYTNSLPYIENDGGGTFGGGPPFTNNTVITKVLGTNEVGDLVFLDDGFLGGTIGNGIKDGGETGISNITVTLFFDGNTNGVLDASDILMGTQVTDTNGYYLFDQLGAGHYIVIVDDEDTDLPFGSAVTLPVEVSVLLGPTGTNSYLDADFAFAPVLALTKSIVGGITTNREGSTITYQLVVTNRLAGTGGLQVYDVWAEAEDVSSKPWDTSQNAYIPPGPDGICTSNDLEAATETLMLTKFQLGYPAGSISNVQLVIAMDVVGIFNGADNIEISILQRGGSSFYTTNVIANVLATNIPAMIVDGELVLNATTNRAWTWGDFNDTNIIIQLDARKAGGPNSGWVLVDAAGFRITTDWVGGDSDPSLTLDPVPVQDIFDADFLRYVSSDREPTSVATNGSAPNSVGTIQWSNVGPLYEGGFRKINVTFDVLEPPNNTTASTTNTAAITNAWYGDGRPANLATGSVSSVILPAGTIGDYIWRDLDSDGVQDGGNETGIAGVKVVLWPPVTVNLGNGAGKPITNVTDSSGLYLFKGIPADGSYTVRVDTATLPGGSGTATWDEDGGNDSSTIVVMDYDATNGIDTHLTTDFGYRVNTAIEGTIWYDLNRDGASAPGSGETWLTNVTVYLFNGSTSGPPSSAIATNRTGTNGYFRFVGSYSGSYSVLVVTNSGMMSTGSWTESFDTDGLGTANYVPLSVVTGGMARADFSYYRTGPYSIGDQLFYDWNGNGIQDASDEGIANITVSLYRDVDGDGIVNTGIDALIATNSTTSSGGYLFTTLPSTNYIMIVDQSDPDFPDRFINTADPYGINDGRSKLTLTTNRLDQDFGYQPLGNGSIGDTVWFDVNGDGVQSGPRETGLASVTVTLLADFNGDGTYVTITNAQTDSNGHYLFSNLPDGIYAARVDENDVDIPLDGFGVRYVPTTILGVNVTITNSSTYLNADFGFTALGAIGDTIFWDANKNGTQDYNEDGIEGVTVRLYNDVDADGYYTSGTDALYGSVITGTNGNYLFTGLPIGKYVVDVVESGPIATAVLMADPSADGLPATDPEAVDVDGEYGVTVYPGTSFMGADFGYVPPGVLGDTLWLDTDSDGILDDGETGIPYITIELWSNGVLVATNEADSSGQYLFQNLADGTYVVVVATNDSDWTSILGQTYDPDGALDDSASAIIISNGVVVSIGGSPVTNADLDIDFGYRYTGTNSLSGTVGLESDPLDGVMGTGSSGYTASNEVPYANVSLYLYLWDDDGDNIVDPGESKLISSTLTVTNGDYSFSNLPEGDGNDAYIVSLFAPELNLVLTTTNGVTPATNVVNTLDPAGNTVSAYQVVPVAPVITDMDFAFRSRLNYDFGDLPSTYSTLIQDVPSGPRHRVKTVPDLYLGSSVDTELNGQPSVGADGDGSDEDGVIPLGVWQNGTNGQVQVQIGKGSGWITGFIDFNGDSDFTDAGEMVFSQAASTNGGGGTGLYTNSFTVSTNAITGTNAVSLYARFRLFDKEPGFPEFSFVGNAENGEVEDYCWQFGALGDYVWRDFDADGVQDASEQPVTNARVYVDINGDGIYQVGEPNDFTGTNGYYYIGGVSTGAYSVLVDTNTISSYIWPSYDLDGTGTAHKATVVMTNGQVRNDVDFGYQTLILGGMIWLDSDRDGTQNEGPVVGVTNITVHLLDYQTNLLSTTVTDVNGNYLFDVDAPGNYLVQFFPIEYEISPRNVGGDDDIDSDSSVSSPYRTELITLAAAEKQTNWDLGVYLPDITNSIGDRVWFDYDRDGIQDAGEAGIQNLTVTLYGSSTNVVKTTLTDIVGNYYFAGIPVGNYFVGFSKLANYQFSPKDAGGNDAVDSDANTTSGYSPVYYITNGFLNHTVDAGMYGIIDLGVTKSVNKPGPNVGEVIQFTMSVSNAGPAAATQVRLKDTWPTNIIYLGAAPSYGSFDSVSNIWNVGSLAVAQVESLVMTGQVAIGTGGKTYTNSIAVANSFEPDTNSVNNKASAVVVVQSVDLGVLKTVNNPAPYEGSNVVYTIVVTNNGPSVATGVRIAEPLTNWISFVSYIASSGTYSSVTGVWDIGTLAVSNSQTLTITANVIPGAGGRTITNISSIKVIDQEDTNPTNNSDDAVITVVGADLGVYKTVDNPGPNENDTIYYTITITNNGPNVPTNIVVYEPLATGLTYVSHVTSAGTYSTNDWKWLLSSLAVDASQSLTIECTVGGGTKFTYITNVSSVVTSSLPDPVTTNNSDEQVIGVADVRIKKTSNIASNGWAYPGSNITYTISVTNQGVPPHENVSVSDILPVGVSFVPASCQITRPFYTNANVRDNFNAAAYTNNNGTLLWANSWQEVGDANNGPAAGDVMVLDDTGVGGPYVLSIENSAKGAWRSANLAWWRWGELRFSYRRYGMDNDTNDYVAVNVSSNGGASWAVLDTIVGTGVNDPAYVSKNYDISAYISTNTTVRFMSGPSLDNNDYLYIDNVEMVVSQRVYRTVATNGPSMLATNLLLLEDEYCVITYDVAVDNEPSVLWITNTAKVTSSLMPLPRQSTVIHPVYYVDLGVTKDISSDSLLGTNEVIWYTINLTNSGPGDATEIVLTDYWPTNVIVSNVTYSTGYYNTTNHTWSGFSLVSNGSAWLVITGQVDNVPLDTVITNIIEVTGLHEFDPNPENDKDDADFDTLVVLKRFEAFLDGDDVVLEWETVSEYNTAGFYVYRVLSNGERELVNVRMVPAVAGYPQGGIYCLRDPNGKPGKWSDYIVVEQETGRKQTQYGPYTVKPRTRSGSPRPLGPGGYGRIVNEDPVSQVRSERRRQMLVQKTASGGAGLKKKPGKSTLAPSLNGVSSGGLTVEVPAGDQLGLEEMRDLEKVWRTVLREWRKPNSISGQAIFLIRLDGNGKIISRELISSSGNDCLDESGYYALSRIRFIRDMPKESAAMFTELKVTFGNR